MSTAVAKREPAEIIEQVIAKGNLAELTPAQRTEYYRAVCESIGLNSLTKPFEYITLNGKLTLYARKDATDQLRKIHGVSVQIVSREQMGDVYVVTARATDARGRIDESVGAVTIGTLKGDAMCNALMKAETKAKRRVTLSICGLGMLDEAEIETIPQTVRVLGPELPPADEPRTYEAMPEPEPVRPVKLEGAQPKAEAAGQWPDLKGRAGQVVALAKALGWAEFDLAAEIQERFGMQIMPGAMAGTLESMQNGQLQEVAQALKAELQGRRS